MSIIIAKLIRKTYSNPANTFHLYQLRVSGGEYTSAVYVGSEPPKALKTVEYQLNGRWEHSVKYGKQFKIEQYQRYQGSDHLTERAILNDARKHLKG